MKKIRILFTGTGRRVELIQDFREAALVLNKEIKIYGADMTYTAPALAYCDYTRIVPAIRDESYIPTLVEICEQDNIDILIPTIDTDLLLLAENKQRFKEIGTQVLISEPEMIKICRDKNVTSQFFIDCGLRAPMPVNDWHEYEGGFPAFIKPKDGSSSINAYKVEEAEELEMYAGQVPEYIVQPYIEGTEYTVDIFCDFDGKPVSIVPRIRLQVRTGEVIKTEIAMDEQIINECRKIIERFRPCGPLTVQLIRDKETGGDYYIEINPRFGGGSPLSMKAGARSAEAILRLLSGETPGYCDKIADGAVYSRFDQTVRVRENAQSKAGADIVIDNIAKVVDIARNMNLKGVIFDLDDTLYSEKEYVLSGYRAVAEHLGSPEYTGKLWHYFEQNKPAIDALLEEIGKESEKDRALEVYRSHKPNIQLYDDVVVTIKTLKEKCIKVGVITDGRPDGQRNKLKSLGLYELIDEDDIIITDDLGGLQFRKPCDIAFRIMQRRWRLPFDQIAYVGDNPVKDFRAPRQLGMISIYIPNEDGVHSRQYE